MQQTFTIDQLKPGMFVDAVLEQKGDLKIKTQGLVSNQSAINALIKKGVLKVSVDLSKSVLQKTATNTPQDESKTTATVNSGNAESFDREITRASKLYQDAKNVQSQILDTIKRGEQLEIDQVESVSSGLYQSIQRNKDALSCLTRMQNKHDYLLEHSVNVAILMGVFANYLDLPEQQCQQLITGALLLDVGKIGVKQATLEKTSKLTAEELSEAQSHVELGYKVLTRSKALAPLSLKLVLEHHERLDGSGYPYGKHADDLDQFSRMAAIVDSYDAIVSNRVYRAAKPPIMAFKILKRESGTKYDAKLVNAFIKCMGIHPVGSLVKLKSNKLGIVIDSNYDNPTSPVVKLFYSVTNKSYLPAKQLDLSAKNCHDEIEKSVLPEDFKLNIIKFFREVFL